MYLKINDIQIVDMNEFDLFTQSDANGKLVVIKSVGIYGDDNKIIRNATLNKELINKLITNKIYDKNTN